MHDGARQVIPTSGARLDEFPLNVYIDPKATPLDLVVRVADVVPDEELYYTHH